MYICLTKMNIKYEHPEIPVILNKNNSLFLLGGSDPILRVQVFDRGNGSLLGIIGESGPETWRNRNPGNTRKPPLLRSPTKRGGLLERQIHIILVPQKIT